MALIAQKSYNTQCFAEVVELADTRGLGPRGIKSLAGSIPVLGIYLIENIYV